MLLHPSAFCAKDWLLTLRIIDFLLLSSSDMYCQDDDSFDFGQDSRSLLASHPIGWVVALLPGRIQDLRRLGIAQVQSTR